MSSTLRFIVPQGTHVRVGPRMFQGGQPITLHVASKRAAEAFLAELGRLAEQLGSAARTLPEEAKATSEVAPHGVTISPAPAHSVASQANPVQQTVSGRTRVSISRGSQSAQQIGSTRVAIRRPENAAAVAAGVVPEAQAEAADGPTSPGADADGPTSPDVQ